MKRTRIISPPNKGSKLEILNVLIFIYMYGHIKEYLFCHGFEWQRAQYDCIWLYQFPEDRPPPPPPMPPYHYDTPEVNAPHGHALFTCFVMDVNGSAPSMTVSSIWSYQFLDDTFSSTTLYSKVG